MPLLEVMDREATRDSGLGTQSKLTKALEMKTRRNQVRAEILLHRKQQQGDIPVQKPTISMYLPEDEFLENTSTQSAVPSAEKEVVSEKSFPLNPQTKKRLPKYLTHDGAIVHGPSEVGEKVHCQPTGETLAKTENSWKSTSHEQEFDKRANYRTRWLPLSSNAVQEYEGTRVLPVKVLSSHQGHGVYSMWKPMSTYTECAKFIT